MAKRFTDTDKYKKPFIRSLPVEYKVLWDYLYHECNHAGIWIVDFEIAKIYINANIDKKIALELFNKNEIRIIELNHGSKWFIPSFIDFQYGQLNENNRAHNSVIQILKKYNLIDNKGLVRGLYTPIDKDIDKYKYKDKEKEKEKEKEKKKEYIENVFLKEKEYNILIEKFGEINTKKILEKLSSYKLAHGKKYKSDYGAINQWVIEALKFNSTNIKNPNLEVII
jgi:hypothetical protein